jgi:hypothetical protein
VLASSATSPGESYDWLTFKLNNEWELPFDSLVPATIAAGGIPDSIDVLIVPQVSATAVYAALGADGREAITSWVRAGGHLVTWGGGEKPVTLSINH